jgi:choline/glycine/proline betaine transport protein
MVNFKQVIAQTTFKKGIIVPSLLFIFFVTFISRFSPALTAASLGHIQDCIFTNLNWAYV